MRAFLFPLLLLSFVGLSPLSFGQVFKVKDAKGLKKAIAKLRPGGHILLAPGHYGSGYVLKGLRGSRSRPIILEGTPGKSLPLFEGGEEGFHLISCHFLVLRRLHVRGCQANAINADDGGDLKKPARGLVFSQLLLEKTGPRGNHDALKLSGLADFTVRDCVFRAWGGSAIDMVGCRKGKIQRCRFEGLPGFSQASGVQTKGGSRDILIQGNLFLNAGSRAVNLGGSTDLRFFRPKIQEFEARRIKVFGNWFSGSRSPIAFVSSSECLVQRNTIAYPEKWVLRILQEQDAKGFKPCQKSRFENNLVLFDQRVKKVVNVGPRTLPKTFVFKKNLWFCKEGKRKPRLPSREVGGIYRLDPRCKKDQQGRWIPFSKDKKIQGIGAGKVR